MYPNFYGGVRHAGSNYTGNQKNLNDAGGRVEKFNKKYGRK